MERLAWALGGGGILGVFAMIVHLVDGKSWRESVQAIPGGMFLGLMVLAWIWWKQGSGAEEVSGGSPDREIGKLQNQLRSAIDAATYNEGKGDVSRAAYFRSQAAVLESQLRRLGA